MKKGIIILGAGVMQIPAIKKAKDMGFFVIASDKNPDAPGFEYADKPLVLDIKDIKGHVDFALGNKERFNISGVLAGADVAVTAASIAEALAKYSKIVDQCIPEGSIVYMTSHAFCAAWQSQRRMIFADDSFVDNQITLSNAFAENAAFVALDDEMGDIDFEDLSRLKLLREIKVSDVEADIAMTIYIYEIVKEKESDGRIQPPLIKILADIQKNIKIIKSAEDRNKINESLESIKESTDRLLCCVKQGMKLDVPFVDKTVYKTACILKTYGEMYRSYNLFNALSHKLTPMDDRDLLARIYFNLGGIKREAGDI